MDRMATEELKQFIESTLKKKLYEMARINSVIEVTNEDVFNSNGVLINKKFAHFHWLYNRKIHFKFSNRLPKNVSELKKLIAFESEKSQISTTELKKVLIDISKKMPNENIIVFDKAKNVWCDLHKERNITDELIIL